MTNHSINHKFNLLLRSKWGWHLSAYCFLALNIILMIGKSQSFNPTVIFLGLSTLLALWYIPFITTSIFSWGGRPNQKFLYLLLGWALWAGLVSLSPTSLMLIGMFCPLVFTRYPIRRAIAIASVQIAGIYSVYAFVYQVDHWPTILLTVFGLAMGVNLIAHFYSDQIACQL